MISTRFSGLDGVSLEAAKVADALRPAGFDFAWFGGDLGEHFTPGSRYPKAHFGSEENQVFQTAFFGSEPAPPEILELMHGVADELEDALTKFVEEHAVEVLMPQNILAIPMHFPLAMATARLIRSSGLTAIGHHHDFHWERERYSECVIPRLLAELFPPIAPNLAHVTINRDAADELLRRTGVADATVLPNVMDFANPPEQGNRARFREAAQVSDDEWLLLQPTRVIPRKGIELTLDLAAAVEETSGRRAVVIVSHDDDLLTEYWARLEEKAARLGVGLRLVPVRKVGANLADAYAAADLVCFPSLYEGFGNALLEGVYFERPMMVNRYSVFVRDIAPAGFRFAEADGSIDDDTVAAALKLLADPAFTESVTSHNYEVGRRHFSFDVVRERLLPLLQSST